VAWFNGTSIVTGAGVTINAGGTGLVQTNNLNNQNAVLIATNNSTGTSAHSLAAFINNTGLSAGFYLNGSNRSQDAGVNGFGFYNDATLGAFQFSAAGDVFMQTNRASGNQERLRLYRLAGTVFNEPGNDYDFRIEGDTDANLFTLDAGIERVGVGVAMASHAAKFHVKNTITGAPTVVSQNVLTQTADNWQALDAGGGTLVAIRANGSIAVVSLADSAAVDNSLYYSATQSKLVYKIGGVANPLH
jgi:hypothetical protein